MTTSTTPRSLPWIYQLTGRVYRTELDGRVWTSNGQILLAAEPDPGSLEGFDWPDNDMTPELRRLLALAPWTRIGATTPSRPLLNAGASFVNLGAEAGHYYVRIGARCFSFAYVAAAERIFAGLCWIVSEEGLAYALLHSQPAAIVMPLREPGGAS